MVDLPLIDEEQYQTIVDAGGDSASALIEELVALFELENRPHLLRLLSAFRVGDSVVMLKSAHVIAGSSANLGGFRLAAFCRHVEARGLNSQPVGQKEIDQIECCFDETLAALRACLEE